MATGVDKILRQLGGTPDKNKTGVDQIVEILENGGGGGGGGGLLQVVNTAPGEYTLGDISYNDVRALLAKGIVPIAHYTEEDNLFPEFSILTEVLYQSYDSVYRVSFYNTFFFSSETADGTLT